MKNKEDKRLFLPRDEFEEEAGEGLGKLSREEAEEDLRELKSRMDRRIRNPLRIWMPAAAAVITLLIISAVYIALFRQKEQMQPVETIAGVSAGDTALIAMAEPVKKTEEVQVFAEKKEMPRVAVSEKKAVQRAAVEDKNTVPVTQQVFGVTGVSDTVIQDMELDEVIVTEEDVVKREEIAGAVAKIARMKGTDKAAERDLAIKNDMTNTQAKQAEPVGGWEEFREWIRRNIKYPEEISPESRQVIVVSFKVAADSTLYDMKAERTAGEPFTEEAFRLLREGPKWEPAIREGKVVEEEVRVTIVFK